MPTDRGETMHTCTVSECERPIKNKTHGLCDPHYKRLWSKGDVLAHIPLRKEHAKPLPAEDTPDGQRICLECGAKKPLAGFHADKRSPKGRRKVCRTCRTAAEMERYWIDPDATRSRVRQYRRDNPHIVRATDNQRYERDKTKRIAAATEAVHRRRARMFGSEHVRGITTPAVRNLDGDTCCYCGTTMTFGRFPKGQRPDNMATLEHIIPLSRGGTHTWENVALSCWRDNITKGAATEGWRVREGHRLASGDATWQPLARA